MGTSGRPNSIESGGPTMVWVKKMSCSVIQLAGHKTFSLDLYLNFKIDTGRIEFIQGKADRGKAGWRR